MMVAWTRARQADAGQFVPGSPAPLPAAPGSWASISSSEGRAKAFLGTLAPPFGVTPAALLALLALLRLPLGDPAAHLLHHLAHLLELADQLGHLRGRGARPPGDAVAPRVVDQVGPDTLLGGHRPDDALDPSDLTIVDLDVADLLGDARQHAHHPGQRSHLLERLHLVEEVVEGERPLHQAGRRRLGLVLLEDLLGLLDQRRQVALAEDPAGEAVGVEQVEVLDLLPRGGEGDRDGRRPP
jgi:hypothetical protein